jgi:hypothetical protein
MERCATQLILHAGSDKRGAKENSLTLDYHHPCHHRHPRTPAGTEPSPAHVTAMAERSQRTGVATGPGQATTHAQPVRQRPAHYLASPHLRVFHVAVPAVAAGAPRLVPGQAAQAYSANLGCRPLRMPQPRRWWDDCGRAPRASLQRPWRLPPLHTGHGCDQRRKLTVRDFCSAAGAALGTCGPSTSALLACKPAGHCHWGGKSTASRGSRALPRCDTWPHVVGTLIHRFGSSLNAHVHFHVCVVDGVFEEIPVALEWRR